MKSRLTHSSLVLLAPLLLFLLHTYFYRSYGIFRDEFYYFICGLRPAWGYVDQPPLVAWISHLLSYLFHQDLSLYRFWSFAVAAAHLALVLAWVRRQNGGPLALSLVAVALIMSPIRLGVDHFYSMNSLEPLLWFAIFWLFSQIHHLRLGAMMGLAFLIGIGTLNKHTTALYAVLLSLGFLGNAPNRPSYVKKIMVLAAVSLIVISPHLLWQFQQAWPTLEFQQNARLYKNEALSVTALLGELILHHHPLVAFLWVPGLFVLLTRARWRFVRPYAWVVVLFCLLLIPAHGKTYYAASLIAPLIAVGALEFEALGLRLRWLFPLMIGLSGLILLPLSLPVLPVHLYQAYEEALGFRPASGENHSQGALPQHYADMFGWRELVETIAAFYQQLPEPERAVTAIYAQNYGQAGAIDYHGPALGLPPASSGHNNYFLWGFHPANATQLLIIGGQRENHEKTCGTLRVLGTFDHPLRMPYERHLVIYLCQDLKRSMPDLWPSTRNFI
ncbi:MAG TPA: glycosyltransferase family 39 protein [Oligoflexus sp.]|uniref:glycosyltransferase family 39 protein n=1 Tax=Oligoflexus sp. TaxID=1971216 RepID=UPI002D605936|nr:glycosyltransferase family 39 protein [Oligoflexus sp.]HYX36985.1 glycosyltransferase family 39 protein [Oligoflexus sp.]